MKPLKKELPSSDKILYVFHNFETTRNTRYPGTAAVRFSIWYAYSKSVDGARIWMT